jgi:ankyrin repeat protein
VKTAPIAVLLAAAAFAQDTPLLRAVHDDDARAAGELIRAGADVKAPNRYGVTPLAVACENGSAAMIDLLLKAGADAAAPLPGGETPLMTASRTGKLDAVKVLLARGVDVHAKEAKRGQTAIMWAAAEGHADVVEALIAAGADFKARLDSGFTPLLFAAREGKKDVVRVLLKAGADVNETVQPKRPSGGKAPRAGSTALHLATGNAHYELAAFLVEAGADPNAGGPGYTVLHMIPSLRKAGGGDNDPSPDGSGTMTSLQFVKFLVEHKANVNARTTRRVGFGLTSLNTLGSTPFLLAARTADAELMRFLAKLGADPLIPNAENSTPLIVAAGLGTRSPGEDAGTESEVVEALRVALELGNNIDAVDNNGETAMHGAAYKNYPAAVEFLASKGAKIDVWNRPNKQGWTPLIIAQGLRFGNYKPSPVTVAAFAKILTAAGLPVPDPPKRTVGVN